MKVKILVFILLATVICDEVWAQKSDTLDTYPNLVHDFVETNNHLVDLYMQIGIYSFLGIGVNASYFLPKKFYSSINIGYGGAAELNYDPGFTKKNGMINQDIRGGYILFSDIRRSTDWWVVKQKNTYGGKEIEYFTLAAPKHRYLIAEIGYSSNPTAWYAISIDGNKAAYNFYAPVLNLGLRWKKIRNVYVKVTDKENSDRYRGRLRGFGEIYAGFVLPLKNQIDAPSIYYLPLEKTNMIGFSIFAKTTFSDSNLAVYFGYSTVGYANASHYFFGASMYIGSTRR